MSRWWRAYDEAVDDPKLILLTDQQHRSWFNLCCIASQSGGVLPAVAVIAVKLRVKPDRAKHVIAELVALGLIDHDGGKFEMHNWRGRQFQESGAADKATYVYVIGQNWDGHVKIGISKNPWARLGELQTGSPMEMTILATFRCQKKFHSEVDLHELLKPWRSRGEWFDLPATVTAKLKNYYAEKKSYDDVVVLLRSSAFLLRSSGVGVTTTDTERTETERKERDISRAREAENSEAEKPKSPMIRPEAHSISDECYRALGIELQAIPPDWYALAYQIDMMLARGYDPPNIVATFAKLGGQKPLKPMNYFIKAVESSQQNQIKPAGAPSAKSGNVVQAIDKLVQHLAYFDQPAPDEAGVCSGEGQTPLRLLPPGRCQ